MYCSPFFDHLADPYSFPSYGFDSSYLYAKNTTSKRYIPVKFFNVSKYVPKNLGLNIYPNVKNGFDIKYVKFPTNGKLASISGDARTEPCTIASDNAGIIIIAIINHTANNKIKFFFNNVIILLINFMFTPSYFFYTFY